MRNKKEKTTKQEETVHSLQNQVFHMFFGPMGLGETLANFFLLASWEVMGNPMNGTEKKQEKTTTKKENNKTNKTQITRENKEKTTKKEEKVHCLQNQVFYIFFWACGPRAIFFCVLGSDGNGMVPSCKRSFFAWYYIWFELAKPTNKTTAPLFEVPTFWTVCWNWSMLGVQLFVLVSRGSILMIPGCKNPKGLEWFLSLGYSSLIS